jgi:glucosamine--fructose-6-phosphate aminotransferase (isomerizing)
MHGPMTLAGPHFPVILFSQNDEALSNLTDLSRTLVGWGVPIFLAEPAVTERTVALHSATLHPFAQPIAAIQSFYPLAEALALALGRDPDRPPRLSKVTETI